MNASSSSANIRRREKEAGKRMERARREWRETPKGIDRELAYDDYKTARDEYLTALQDHIRADEIDALI